MVESKEYPVGATFYTRRGLKSVVVYLTKEYHAKLKAIAQKEERSIQKTARRILENSLK